MVVNEREYSQMSINEIENLEWPYRYFPPRFAHKVYITLSKEHYVFRHRNFRFKQFLLMMNLFTRDDKLLLEYYFHLALRVQDSYFD